MKPKPSAKSVSAELPGAKLPGAKLPGAKLVDARSGTAATPLELDRFVPYRLVVLADMVGRSIARLYERRFGLSIAEWRVMAVLGQHGRLTANECVARTAMDKVRVSRAVRRLLSSGLIIREVDRRDRRRAGLALSGRGRAVYQDIVPLALGEEARLLAVLDAEDRAQLDGLLTRLQARAQALAEG
jgi:DNA-binding MarR family transcriptional regulator